MWRGAWARSLTEECDNGMDADRGQEALPCLESSKGVHEAMISGLPLSFLGSGNDKWSLRVKWQNLNKNETEC